MYKYLFLILRHTALPSWVQSGVHIRIVPWRHICRSGLWPIKGNPAKVHIILSQTLYLYTIFPKSQPISSPKLVKTTNKKRNNIVFLYKNAKSSFISGVAYNQQQNVPDIKLLLCFDASTRYSYILLQFFICITKKIPYFFSEFNTILSQI